LWTHSSYMVRSTDIITDPLLLITLFSISTCTAEWTDPTCYTRKFYFST